MSERLLIKKGDESPWPSIFVRGFDVVTRSVTTTAWAFLAILGLWTEVGRAGDLVELKGWAEESAMVRGSSLTNDIFTIVAEVDWDKSAPKEPSRYLVRVAYPDGRVDNRTFPVEYPPGRRRLPVYVRAESIRDLVPSGVKVAVTIVDSATGTPVSNTLTAGIDQFPRSKGDPSGNDPGPFGWGQPLEGEARILPKEGPGGLKFARITGTPGLFLATTEANITQVLEQVKTYDPKAGRSDEFTLEDPLQPAINMTPAVALEYLKGLSQSDPSGLTYRLPTLEEWTAAAKSGKTTAFWWGDDATFPEGANLLGPEPALPGDATAPSTPSTNSPTFKANPFGLAHTFGNAAEWATDPAGGFVRLGGHFRTEPASPLPVVKVEKAEELGPDPFVGVRPAFTLTPESASVLIRKILTAADPALAGVGVGFDLDTATATLTGSVADSSARRSADKILEGVWFVACVVNKLATAAVGPNQLAILGPVAGPSRKFAVLDRSFVEIPLAVHWLDPLPVLGSSWWINIYLPGGGHLASKLDPGEPGRASKLMVRVDRSKLAGLGLADDSPVKIALSIGSALPDPTDSRIVSNLVEVRPTFPPRTR